MTRKSKIPVPDHIESLIPYPPGKPIEELRRELGVERIIKLASNENPVGPSPKALEAMKKAVEKVNRYPDGSAYYLKQKLSRKLGVSPGQLILGNGSNEIIELIFRTFYQPGDNVVSAEITFAVYPIIAHAIGAEYRAAPMKNLSYDMEELAKLIDDNTKFVFISNPNNPTGTYITRNEFENFMKEVPETTLVVLDEAYFEFVERDDYPNGLDYLEEFPNLIVMRTFSKIYGLAGLRIGYGIGSEDIIDYLNRVRQPFNVNLVAQEAALAALDDEEFVTMVRNLTHEGLNWLYSEVEKLGLNYVPSVTNFFLIEVGKGKKVYDALLHKGVIVRPMDGYKLPQYIRVNVGTEEENKIFIDALEEVLAER